MRHKGHRPRLTSKAPVHYRRNEVYDPYYKVHLEMKVGSTGAHPDQLQLLHLHRLLHNGMRKVI
jgi:hypothetical protein